MQRDDDVSFSKRIHDRRRRWWVDKEPIRYKNVGGKLEGRAFAEEHGCPVPVLYALADQPEQLPSFSDLPNRFVIKPTRGWSARNVFAIENGINLLDGGTWSREDVVETLKAQREADGTPRLRCIVEEFLINWDEKPGIPNDYKFYTFGSEVAFIHVIERNSAKDLSANRHWFLTEAWESLGHRVVVTQTPEENVPEKPGCFDELLGLVKHMGGVLNMFMRIDMYATLRGPVFGEFTPQPHGGNGYTEWADRWLGSLWKGVEGCS